LSGLKPEELDAFLARISPAPKTAKTLTDPKRIAEAVARAGREGYAVVDEELEIGMRSIAVPLRDRAGTIVAAINVSTQSARHSVAEMEHDFLPLLKQTAGSIEDFFVQ